MKVAFTGVTGFKNRGVEALVQSLIWLIREQNPDVDCTIFSATPDYDVSRVQTPKTHILKEGNLQPARNKITRRLPWLEKWVGSSSFYPNWEALRSADVLFVTGGDVFSSEYGMWSLQRHLLPLRLARRFGIPCYLIAQSIGPFKAEVEKKAFQDAAASLRGISVRETLTKNYLLNEIGIPAEKIFPCIDPAFALPPAPVAVVGSDGKPVVGISLSAGIAEWLGVSPRERVQHWAALCRKIIAEWNARIMLIPHVHESFADDRIICSEVWRALDFNQAVKVFAEDLSASEYKGLIAQADYMIAERMHAGVAGLSQCVPTTLVSYSVKSTGIITDLAGKELSEKGCWVAGQDLQDLATIWPKLNYVWENRLKIKQVLQDARAGYLHGLDHLFCDFSFSADE